MSLSVIVGFATKYVSLKQMQLSSDFTMKDAHALDRLFDGSSNLATIIMKLFGIQSHFHFFDAGQHITEVATFPGDPTFWISAIAPLQPEFFIPIRPQLHFYLQLPSSVKIKPAEITFP